MQNSNQNRCPECEKNSESLLYRPMMEDGGNWIQSAIKHPGRCTPGSPNYDCPEGSPQWNLAQRFKHGDLHKAQEGGQQKEQMMQIIMAYAQLHQVKPEEVIQQIQKLSPEEQQQAMQTMVTELQGDQGGQPESQVTEQTEYPQEGGFANGGNIPEGNPYGGGEYRYDFGGNYPVSGITGLSNGAGRGLPYAVPMINAATGDAPIFEPLKAISGFMGAATSLAGAGLGFGKAAQWAGNKILPEGKFKSGFNSALNTANDFTKNVMDIGSDLNFSGIYENQIKNKLNTLQQNNRPLDQQYIRDARNEKGPNLYYSKPVNGPEYQGEYDTMVAAYGGVLPQAQFGFTVPQGPPYAQQNNTLDPNQFPQNNTTDAFTRSQGQQVYDQYNNAVKSFANPFDTNNMSQFDLNNFNKNKIPFPKPPQAPEDYTVDESQFPQRQGNDMASMVNQDRQMVGDTTDYSNNASASQNVQPNGTDFNGMEYAQKANAGAGAALNYLQYKNNRARKREYDAMLKRQGNTDFGIANNTPSQGNYTLNVGFQNFQPGKTTPIQSVTGKYGGTLNRKQYKSGGEYQVSEDELLQLMQNGAEIEFINK